MYTLKIEPVPSKNEREYIRQLIGYYRGIASFSGSGVVIIKEKDGFSKKSLKETLMSLGYKIKEL